MAIQLADAFSGGGHVHLERDDPAWSSEPPPEPAVVPAEAPVADAEPALNWLNQLPAPSAWHPDVPQVAHEWGAARGHSPLLDLPATVQVVSDAGAAWGSGPAHAPAHPPALVAPQAAVASDESLGMTDLVLADPLMREIAQAFGRAPDAPRSALALEQVRLYGEARFEQMSRLHIGMQSVRDQYSAALDRASQAEDGPGWVDVAVQREVVSHSVHGDSDIFERHAVTVIERRFDPDAYTRWYNAQDGLANRAFAQLYGNSHTEYQAPLRHRGEEVPWAGPPPVGRIRFDNAPWHIDGLGAPMRHEGRVGFDLNAPPRMHNAAAVGFDFEVGWSTSAQNIVERPSATRQLVQLAVTVAAGYYTFGAVNAWAGAKVAAGGLGLGAVGAAAVAGGAAAAASSFASGVMNGNLELKNILRSAFSGALTGGLMQGLAGTQWMQNAGHVGQTAARMTVQGGVQALMGGEFKDGAAAALASGLAQAVGQHLDAAIAHNLPPGDAPAARMLTRVVTSAIRALGNPDDPLSAFAGGFLQDVLQGSGLVAALGDTGPTAAARPGVAFDDEGNLMPGVVDSRAPALQQAAQLAATLEGQGFDAEAAAQRAMAAVAQQLRSLAGAGTAAGGASATAGPAPVQDDPAGDTTPRVVITGRSLPRDEFGNRYDTDAQGRTLVLVAGGGVLALPAGTALPVPTGGGAVQLGAATLRLLAGLATTAAQALPDLTLRGAAGAVGGLLLPGNVGQGPQVTELSDGLRFEQRPGEVYGRLLERDPLTGAWELLRSDVRAVPTANGFAVMSDAELARWRAPLTTPAAPQPPGTWPLPVWADRPEVVPPYQAGGPAGPQATTTPAQPVQDWRDLLIHQDARKLYDAMDAAGRPQPGPGYVPHHIVQREGGGVEMAAARTRLAEWGIDLDHEANGAWLPSHRAEQGAPGAYHERLHNDEYRDAVIAMLREASSVTLPPKNVGLG